MVWVRPLDRELSPHKLHGVANPHPQKKTCLTCVQVLVRCSRPETRGWVGSHWTGFLSSHTFLESLRHRGRWAAHGKVGPWRSSPPDPAPRTWEMLGELLTTSSPSIVKRPHHRAHHTCTPAPTGHLPDRGLEMSPLLRNDQVSEPQTNVPAVPRGSPRLPGELAKAGHRDQCGTFPKPSLLCCPSQMAIRGGDWKRWFTVGGCQAQKAEPHPSL